LKEKIAQEEKEERNAVEKRERLFSRGKPMAPYNTTQFLVEDHEKRTMPPDVSDSLPAMVAHQRQSTGVFSPARERFILLIIEFFFFSYYVLQYSCTCFHDLNSCYTIHGLGLVTLLYYVCTRINKI
uniref:TPX2 domain-containing protein n=1 Tax=Brugia timori TaxID=42155 RepID=A0A0R3QAD4_9BILA